MSRSAVARIVGLAVLLGVALGLVWALLAPPAPAAVADDGRVVLVDPQSADGFDPVGLFLTLTLATGVLGGLAVWAWRSQRGPRVLIVSTLAGGVGAGVAAAVGMLVVGLRYDGPVAAAEPGSLVDGAPGLGSWAVVLAAPLGVALTQTLLVALGGSDDLGRGADDSRPGGASVQ